MSKFEPRAELEREKTSATQALDALYRGFTPTDGIGFGKRVGDGTHIAVERITEVGTQEILLRKLDRIERALTKLDEGTYGLCDECGEAIPEARLEARPASTTCLRHS